MDEEKLPEKLVLIGATNVEEIPKKPSMVAMILKIRAFKLCIIKLYHGVIMFVQ